MTMLHEEALTFTTENTVTGPVEYHLTPSTRDGESDTPPVVFVARSGVAFFQDYFTPEQAEEMAAAWVEVARRARAANGLPTALPVVPLVTVAGRDDGVYAFSAAGDAQRFRDAVVKTGAGPDDVTLNLAPLCDSVTTNALIESEES